MLFSLKNDFLSCFDMPKALFINKSIHWQRPNQYLDFQSFHLQHLL